MDRSPVILFSSFFLLMILGGVAAVLRSSKSMLRWQGAAVVIFGVAGLTLTVVSFHASPLGKLSFVGAYQGTEGGGTDTLLIHQNGTFDQRLVDSRGHVQRNHGKWDGNGHNSVGNGLNFTHYLMSFDGFGKPQTPAITNFADASVWSDRIVFDGDNDIALGKISDDDRRWP